MPPVPAAVLGALALVLVGCTASEEPPRSQPARPSDNGSPSASSSPEPTVAVEPGTDEPDADALMDTVRELAALGPREATSRQFRRAAQVLEDRLTAVGYEVTRTSFRVPAGESWGVPVDAGRSFNLVARLPGSSASDAQQVVVGAHLDTVPQAPGAEDNASGVAVVLELAHLAEQHGTRAPVTFVLFGAEEPRGPGDDEHHFGSQHYVGRIERGAETAPAAMVSLDRVGAPGRVPVCTGGLSPRRVVRGLLDVADRLGVPTRACENRTSDHWPFEKAGETVARLGGNEYAAYHSQRDLPRVVSPRQLDRVARVMWEWLRAG